VALFMARLAKRAWNSGSSCTGRSSRLVDVPRMTLSKLRLRASAGKA
jgi:hypothetical protein